jgi:hypothetical protein
MFERTTGRAHALGGGVLAGIFGGLVLTGVLIALAHSAGQDMWGAVKGASSPIYHDRAHLPGFDAGPVLLGLVGHFAISVVWGVLFAAIFYGLSRPATVLAGAAWGVVVWLVMYYLVMPFFGLAAAAAATPVVYAIALHVMFGMAVAIGFLPFQVHVRTVHRTGYSMR